MTIKLTMDEFNEQFQETDEETLQWDSSDKLDITCKFDARISQGWRRIVELRDGLQLNIDSHKLNNQLDLCMDKHRNHNIHIGFVLSGKGRTMYATSLTDSSIEAEFLYKSGKYSIQSNGLFHQRRDIDLDTDIFSFIDVEIRPEVLFTFAASSAGELPENLKHLIQPHHSETKYIRYGDTQPDMSAAIQQILHCSYKGIVKRTYLESKAIELIALVLDHEVTIQQGEINQASLRPEQLERIHYAKEILLSDLGNPPSLEELARQTGLNDLLLRQGFRQAFGTTVFATLKSHRLELAKQFLAEQDLSVGEVAHRVGYASVSSFSRAFEHKFGIRPKAYQKKCR